MSLKEEKIINEAYFEGEAHDRLITVCAVIEKFNVEYYTNKGRVAIGISICHPSDNTKKELGREISKGRALAVKSEPKSTLAVCPRDDSGRGKDTIIWDTVLYEDKFFLEQIARSYFFDVRHNPKKYIAGYED